MKKRLVSLFMAVLMLTSLFAVAPVEAASAPSLPENVLFWKGQKEKITFPLGDMVTKGAQITKLKSSNKKIATAKVITATKYDTGKKYAAIKITPKKVGKTKITCTVKYGKKTKKTKKLSTTVYVVKYTNPCASFKIGSKNYSTKFKKHYWADIKAVSGSKTLSIKAKSGWKLTGIYAYTKGDFTRKELTNNKKVTPSKYRLIGATFKNKKSGVSYDILLYLDSN